MARTQHPLLDRMVRRPPKLRGGFALRAEPLDDRHVLLTVRRGDARLQLRAAALSVPYRSALERLLAVEPDVEAVVVERVPRGLAAAAEQHGIGYLDVHGQGLLVGPHLVYYAAPASQVAGAIAPPRASAFAPKASRVVRALLSDPLRGWRLTEVATLIDLYPGNVHRTLASLQQRGLVERDRDRYVVPDPGSLLEAWAEAALPAKHGFSLPVEGDLNSAVADLVGRVGGEAVVSGELAAELLVQHLPARSALVHCLEASAWHRLEPVDMSPPGTWAGRESGRIVVDLPDEGVAHFGASIDGLPLVGPAQLYVDLSQSATRGRQAAEEVRRQLLRY
jgi:hypothetical protein